MSCVGRIVLADNLRVLAETPDESVDLIYVDPPFNTGRRQTLTSIRSVRDEAQGDRQGFQGRRYRTLHLGTSSYLDIFDDYLEFLEPRLKEFERVLKPTGTLYVHLDFREVHYCKIVLDAIFGRASFLNEVIWAYDYGGRTTKRWPPKHDNILVYVKDPRHYYFDADAAERIPYMAPGLVGPEKAARGKRLTDARRIPPGCAVSACSSCCTTRTQHVRGRSHRPRHQPARRHRDQRCPAGRGLAGLPRHRGSSRHTIGCGRRH